MLKIDNFIDTKIGELLVLENRKERSEHKSSGKLSASQLGDPLQWQILKALGAEQTEFDEYTLRKFKRGKDIENWVLQYLSPLEAQKFVEYRDTIGYIDAVCDTKDWQFNVGIVPVEVKSVSNAKFKRITRNGPDRGHCLQVGLYSKAMKADHGVICYIASDDLRVRCYIIKTDDYANEIDEVITRFQTQLATGTIPVFQAREKWQADDKYCRYLSFRDKTAEQLAEIKLNGKD